MNRRTFIQSVIAVPLVAVGMPRAQTPQALKFHPLAFSSTIPMPLRMTDAATGISMRPVSDWDKVLRLQREYNRLSSARIEFIIASV